jgi:glycerol uptake facilitator-like aquaporin
MSPGDDAEFGPNRSEGRICPKPEFVSNSPLRKQTTCFFEQDPEAKLSVRMLAEALGTLLLSASVVGVGVATQKIAHGGELVGVLASAMAISSTLASLIVAFGAVSGGHFNPLITGLQWLARERRSDCAAAYVVAQIVGGVLGALLVGTFVTDAHPAVASLAPSSRLLASETFASWGLMLVVFGCARSGRAETGPFAVGAWLAGAIVVSPSDSYANPALILASILSSGPSRLSTVTAIGFVAAELGGALLAFATISALYPRPIDMREQPAHAADDRSL